MKIKAINQYSIPNYPGKHEALDNPALLKKHIPETWKKIFGLGTSGAMFLSLCMAGCSDSNPDTASTDSPSTNITTNDISTKQNSTNHNNQNKPVQRTYDAAYVAPIFEHGEGRGATGCMVISPPIFLTEDEAFLIIKEELAQSGINLNKQNIPLNNVKIAPSTSRSYVYGVESDPIPVIMDGQDETKNVTIEFVSREDNLWLGGKFSGSSVQDYDLKKNAQTLQHKLKLNTDDGIYAVFYDPMNKYKFGSYKDLPNQSVSPREAYRIARNVVLEASKDQLRLQVQDFVNWYKSTKVD